MNITDSILYIGVNDHELDLFESQYPVPNGMSYNSYAIIDESIAIMDSVEADFAKEWFTNIKNALDGKSPDYLIVQHMEPDHSANINIFMDTYPNARIVSSAKSFSMMKNYFGTDYAGRSIIVGEGDTLKLGKHTLTFITAPMVHWPEVIVTYDSLDKVLFSADAFGKFGSLQVQEDWIDEARRYYFGIVAKYGAQVQALLKKAGSLEIEKICSLHGPVLSNNIDYYLNLYQTWSSYGVETEGIVIAHTSIYGNTKKAVELLNDKLKDRDCSNVVLYDLSRCDLSQAVADAFRYSKLVLATPTYNGDVFPYMRSFIEHLTERNFQGRKLALVENGSWTPTAAKVMQGMLEKSKNITYCETNVKILSAVSDENVKQIDALADELCRD